MESNEFTTGCAGFYFEMKEVRAYAALKKIGFTKPEILIHSTGGEFKKEVIRETSYEFSEPSGWIEAYRVWCVCLIA